MKRAGIILTLAAFCLPVFAHLNHVQFATVEELDGKLVVRYRMSADMFTTNLELLIKSGAMPVEIKKQPIDKMFAAYFEKHLMISAGVNTRSADSVSFKFDDKNGDWVSEFRFTPTAGKMSLFCDAFLENNPNTQTLARINFRGEQTVFHFRKNNVEFFLKESSQNDRSKAGETETRTSGALNGLASGLRAYGLILFFLIVYLVLRAKLGFLLSMLCLLIPLDLAISDSMPDPWKMLGILIVILTVQHPITSHFTLFKRTAS